MENKLSNNALIDQQICLELASSLIAEGYPIVMSLDRDGDYKTLYFRFGSEDAYDALMEIEQDLMDNEAIYFDRGTSFDGVREWSLDWSLENKE